MTHVAAALLASRVSVSDDEGSAESSARTSFVQAVRSGAEVQRVLVVDDDDEARAATASALRDVGFHVDEASNGLDALKIFAERRPHFALLEVMMPFMDGFSTCRAMREMPGGNDASIVMMTDLEDVESLTFGYDAGATDFITKPVNAIVLQHRVKYMLRSADLLDQLRRSERKIAHLAYHDALTGLPNRRSLERYMDYLMQAQIGARPAGAAFMIDLDGFKRVNDTFGHKAGDELICEVGRRVVECFGIDVDAEAPGAQRPFLARLGGDEFVFVEPTVATADDASHVASRMLKAIGSVFDLRGHEIVITASIGISLVADSGGNVESLILGADAAMYDAKAHDRNNAKLYSKKLSDKARLHLELESALRQALAKSEFEVRYQPKICLATGAITGAEALLRWHSPELGLVSPDRFIPVAEETGLIVPIGRWVLEQVCRQAREWHELPEMSGMRIACNVSARQFREPSFRQEVRDVLAESGLDPRALELEITEGTFMNDSKLAREILRELKELGVWLALDDFGTGYSSLGYLRRFPFDTLKVDRSFIRDVFVDEGSRAITGAVVAMAQTLKLVVVAEGVETKQQLDFLTSLGCHEVQGFYFSHAISAPEFAEFAAGKIKVRNLELPRLMAADGRRSAIPPMRPR